MKNKNKLHSNVTILALAVASIFGELYSVDINAAPAPTPTPAPRLNYKRTKFTPEEDKKIKDLVEIYNISNWGLIANNVPGRSPNQCRDRYFNYLSPGAPRPGDWTVDEERLLIKLYKELGPRPKWSLISKYFPGRTYGSVHSKISNLYPNIICNDILTVNRIYGTNFAPRQVLPFCSLYVLPLPPIPNNIQNPPTVILQTESENQLTQRSVEEEEQVESLHIHHPNPIPSIDTIINQLPNRRENSIIAPQIENENQFLVRERVDNEIPTFHLLPTIPDMVPQIENRNQLPQIRITEEEQVESLHIHHPNPIPSIDTIINQLPNRRVEEEDQTLTFNPEFTMPIISRQERPNLLPTFNLLEEPDFYSSNMGSQMRNENQFSERESGAPSFYGLSIPPLQQHRLFDNSSLTNTNDQEEDPIMRSHNNISSRPQRLSDFIEPLAPSNLQPQHRLFDISLDIDPSSTNTENQEEDSSRRRFPSLFDDDSFSFKPKRFRDFDDFL